MVVLGGLLIHQMGRRWGATTEEVHASLPGDEVILNPVWQTTHGITIQAGAPEIWPWLAQMGITRGGWYLSQRLDRIIWRIDSPSVDQIVPELQYLEPGHIIPDSVNGTAHFRVISVQPNKALVLHSRRHPRTGVWPDLLAEDPGLHLDFSWAFVLNEIDERQTRLLIRSRGIVMSGKLPAPRWIRFLEPVADFADFLYTRQMLRGIKRRAERSRVTLANSAHAVIVN